jgi:hypothetical protein
MKNFQQSPFQTHSILNSILYNQYGPPYVDNFENYPIGANELTGFTADSEIAAVNTIVHDVWNQYNDYDATSFFVKVVAMDQFTRDNVGKFEIKVFYDDARVVVVGVGFLKKNVNFVFFSL